MTRFRVWTAVALAAGLSLATGVFAQQPPNLLPIKGQPKGLIQPKLAVGQPKLGQGQPVPVASNLPIVPPSSGAFLSLKLSDVIDHPDLKAALEQLKKNPEALDGFTEIFGVTPHEIERVTLFWPTAIGPATGEPIVVVTTRQAYNEVRVLKALRAEPMFDGFNRGNRFDHIPPKFDAVPKAAVKEAKSADFTSPPIKEGFKGSPPPPPIKPEIPHEDGDTFPISAAMPDEPFVYEIRGGPFELLFIADERTLVFMGGGHRSEFNMMAFFSQLLRKKQTGPLTDAIADAGNHTLAGGVYLTPVFREFERGMPRELAPYAALVAARTGTITGDLTKTAKFTVKLSFDDATAAKRAAPVLDEGLKALAEKVVAEADRMKDSRRPGETALSPLLVAAAGGMKNATVKADGATVVATTEIDAGAVAAKAIADLLQSVTSRKKFVTRSNNLKQIGLALHNYHDANGHLPMNVYGPNGEPLLSWRVHLLPYLEQDNLYKQFKMDEPWDGPNNKKLIEKMPKVFEVLGHEAPKNQTYYQAFLTRDPQRPLAKGEKQFNGRSWLVEGGKVRSTLVTIFDGTSNTIGVVEARTGAIWSKPDDLPFGEKLPPLGAEKEDSFLVLMLDGSVRTIRTNIKPDILRMLIDGQDGMVIPDDVFDDHPRRPGGGGGDRGPEVKPTPPEAKIPKEPVARDAPVAIEKRLEAAQTHLLKAKIQSLVAEQDRIAMEQLATQTFELFKSGKATREEVENAKSSHSEARIHASACKTNLMEAEVHVRGIQREIDKK